MIGSRERLAVAVFISLLLGCDGRLLGEGSRRQSTVSVDVSALHRVVAQGLGSQMGTVASSVALFVEESDGSVQVFDHALTATDSVISFPVTVEEGVTWFTAEVLSNNETLLYSGADTIDVRADGFRAEISLQARSAILTILPDSVVMTSSAGAFFYLTNRGSDVLEEWQITEVAPPNTSCGSAQCLFFRNASGGPLAPGQRDSVRVSLGPVTSIPTTAFTVRFSSEVGDVLVRVILPRD